MRVAVGENANAVEATTPGARTAAETASRTPERRDTSPERTVSEHRHAGGRPRGKQRAGARCATAWHRAAKAVSHAGRPRCGAAGRHASDGTAVIEQGGLGSRLGNNRRALGDRGLGTSRRRATRRPQVRHAGRGRRGTRATELEAQRKELARDVAVAGGDRQPRRTSVQGAGEKHEQERGNSARHEERGGGRHEDNTRPGKAGRAGTGKPSEARRHGSRPAADRKRRGARAARQRADAAPRQDNAGQLDTTPTRSQTGRVGRGPVRRRQRRANTRRRRGASRRPGRRAPTRGLIVQFVQAVIRESTTLSIIIERHDIVARVRTRMLEAATADAGRGLQATALRHEPRKVTMRVAVGEHASAAVLHVLGDPEARRSPAPQRPRSPPRRRQRPCRRRSRPAGSRRRTTRARTTCRR